MGNLISRRRANDNLDASGNGYFYHYPPKGGKFFGTSFIMGGDKFNMSQPESYLFGENYDLNYLGGRPNPFPYSAPLPGEPMEMLKALINIRKETLKLVNPSPEAKEEGNNDYSIEFILDSDVDCSITFYYQCREEVTPNGVKYITKHSSETFHYKAGIGQQFSECSSSFNPTNYGNGELYYTVIDEKGEFNSSALYPVVIHCVADLTDDSKQSHSLVASIEKMYDNAFTLKPLKQKLFVDGLSYLLQEVYGIENKINRREVTNGDENTRSSSFEDEGDNSFECVICMSDLRDTLILPCRHLCLCYNCANSLRYQANNCPICRVPFRALLQLKAVRKVKDASSSSLGVITTTPQDTLGDVIIDIPPGFEAISLVEALNGIIPRQNCNEQYNVIVDKALEESELKSNEPQPRLNSCKDSSRGKDKTLLAKTVKADEVSVDGKEYADPMNVLEDNGSNASSSSASSSSSSSSSAEKTRLIPAKSTEESDPAINKSQEKIGENATVINLPVNNEEDLDACNGKDDNVKA